MPSATLTSKGQITIPKEIREALEVEAGDRLDFVLDGARRVVVRPVAADVEGLKGFLHRPGRRAVSIEEMDAAIVRQHGRR
jgi:antitoxin PrlF